MISQDSPQLNIDQIKAALRAREAPTIFLPIPAYDWKAEVQFMYSFLATVINCHCKVNTIGNFQDGIARTRNGFAAHFLKNLKEEYLFFVDSDIVFTCADFERVMYHMVVGGHKIVAGLYPKKSATLGWVINVHPGIPPKPDPITGLIRARHAGTGFLCVHRSVFEGIREKFPQIQYGAPDLKHHDVAWDFFPMMARNNEYESEDYAFCRMAEEAGFEIWVDTRVQVRHIGKIVFPLHASLTDDEIWDIVHKRYNGFDLKMALESHRLPIHEPALTATD